MPADERFFRNLKTMHVVFAVSAAVMLVTTLLMMWKDHADEWRQYQTTWDQIEAAALQKQIEQAKDGNFPEKIEDLQADLAAAEQSIDRSRLAALQGRVKELQLQADLAGRSVRAQRAFRDVARANFDLAVTQGESQDAQDELQAIFEREQAKTQELELALQESEIALAAAEDELKAETAERDRLKSDLQALRADVERLEKAKATVAPDSRFSKIKRTVMQWPIIDGFNSPHEIKQDWLPDLEIELGMAHSARFDRCRTCHLGIERVHAGNVPAFPHSIPESDDVQDWVADNTFPHPFATHPNPALYLTTNSPHPLVEFGCTVCHEGQGSATSFTNAAHSANNPHIEHHWKDEYGHFVNHFWEYPMHPKRFAESTCLKCHHEVTELAVNEEWGATAPKVHRGYQLIEEYGCFGCHEIHGHAGDERIGPDVRLEPNYFAAALQVIADPNVPDDPDSEQAVEAGQSLVEISRLAHAVAEMPHETAPQREELQQLILADAKLPQPQLTLQTRNLAGEFKSVDHPGEYRKAGPAMRHIAAKTYRDWIEYWVEEPKRFRPETRMPQFFKLTNQQDAHAMELQPVEIAGIAEYLLAKSQPLDLLQPVEGYEPDAGRGKTLFSRRGCLACHTHKDFPQMTADFGPNLTRVAEKLRPGQEGFDWLYTWVRDPHRHDKRTKMPNLFLEPYEDGGETLDPAADIAAYLLQSRQTEPVAQIDEPQADAPPPSEDPHFGAAQEINFKTSIDDELKFTGAALDSLVTLYLSKVLLNPEVEETYTSRKYPYEDLAEIKGDEVELYRPKGADRPSDEEWRRMKLRYIGRRTISRYGCFGCHDIPGFESARPIGTPLQDWGRKDKSQLALEHIEEYLHHHGEPDGGSTRERVVTAMERVRADEYEARAQKLEEQIQELEETLTQTEDAEAKTSLQAELQALREELAAVAEAREDELSAAFFYDSLLHHGRAGFLWQKLRQPRSYDYLKTDTKGYDERLRMPRFPFDEEDIEDIATFVLGLIADPPAEQYVYQPDDRARTRIAGEKLLQKYNCVGCHMMDLPQVTYTLENGYSDFFEMTGDQIADWLVENRDPIRSGELKPEAYPQDVQLMVSLGANVDEIVTLTYDPQADRMRANVKDWLAEHPEVRLVSALAQDEFLPGVKQVMELKPPQEGDVGLSQDETPVIRFHGLLRAAPDPEEPDPEFRFYSFQLFDTLEIGGRVLLPGSTMAFTESFLGEIEPARGGELAQYLVEQLASDPDHKANGNRSKAWEAVPPTLYMEGQKVQTDWLYRFLKNPDRIRHEAVLRMPRFNLSDDEARTLANYFAAVDGAEYPYDLIPQREETYLESMTQMLQSHGKQPEGEAYLPTAWQVLSRNELCVTCHAVGGREFKAGGDPNKVTHGPDLRNVADRLRPEYLQLWLSKPAWVLPYTSMPAPGSKPVAGLFDADPAVQAVALRDALMNYHRMMEREVTGLQKANGGPPATQPAADDQPPQTDTTPQTGNTPNPEDQNEPN